MVLVYRWNFLFPEHGPQNPGQSKGSVKFWHFQWQTVWMNEGISDVHAFPLLWRDMTASSTNDYTGHFSTKVVMAASFSNIYILLSVQCKFNYMSVTITHRWNQPCYKSVLLFPVLLQNFANSVLAVFSTYKIINSIYFPKASSSRIYWFDDIPMTPFYQGSGAVIRDEC